MTIHELITALDYPAAALYVDVTGRFRYVGPKLLPDDPIRLAIAEHRALLTALFTYAPGRRCVFTNCYWLIAVGSKIACPDHCIAIDQESAILKSRQIAPPSGSEAVV